MKGLIWEMPIDNINLVKPFPKPTLSLWCLQAVWSDKQPSHACHHILFPHVSKTQNVHQDYAGFCGVQQLWMNNCWIQTVPRRKRPVCSEVILIPFKTCFSIIYEKGWSHRGRARICNRFLSLQGRRYPLWVMVKNSENMHLLIFLVYLKKPCHISLGFPSISWDKKPKTTYKLFCFAPCNSILNNTVNNCKALYQ